MTEEEEWEVEMEREISANEYKPTGSTAVAISNGGGNPLLEYADAIAPSFVVGKLLKFAKGDYLAGADGQEVAMGTVMIVAADELMVGWVRWVGGKPAEQLLVRINDGQKPLRREQLGFVDKTQWEIDNSGKPRDPWQFTNYLPMADEAGELYTFSSGSKGGLGAIGNLLRRYVQQQKKNDAVFPKIKLGTDTYPHQNKEYGRIKVPVLEPAGWVSKRVFYEIMEGSDFAADNSGGNPAANADTFGDSVPSFNDPPDAASLVSDPIKIAEQRGRDDHAVGKQRRAVPPEYRSPDRIEEADAWQREWDRCNSKVPF